MKTQSGYRYKGILTKSRNNNNLRPPGNQLPKRFRERQIPTNQQPDFPNRRIEHLMRLGPRRGQVWPLRVPDILLAVGREDLARGCDEVCRIIQQGLALALVLVLVLGLVVVSLDNSPRNKTNTQLLGEVLVG